MNLTVSNRLIRQVIIGFVVLVVLIFAYFKWRSRSTYIFPEQTSGLSPSSITSAVVAGSITATVTFANSHNLVPGQTVTISGVTPAGYNKAGTSFTITTPRVFTYTFTGTTALAAATAMGTVTPIASNGNGTLNGALQACYNTYLQDQIAGGAEATIVATRDACAKIAITTYLQGACPSIVDATSINNIAGFAADKTTIRSAYVPAQNPTTYPAELTPLGITYTNVGLASTATQLEIAAQVAKLARDADIAAALRKRLSTVCPGFFNTAGDLSGSTVTSVPHDYSGLTFTAANVTWPNIATWAKRAISNPVAAVAAVSPASPQPIAASLSTATTNITATAEEYEANTPQWKVARFYGPGTTNTAGTLY